MAKLNVTDFNIHVGHSLEEYKYKFGGLYDKCRLTYFLPSELEYMDKTRTYWAIKDKDDQVRYYELPRHTSVFRPPVVPIYRKPLHIGLLIVISTTLLSFTSLIVGKAVYGRKNFDDIPEVNPDDPTELLKFYDNWRVEHPTDDATKTFSVVQLANIAMGKLTHQTKDYFTVGFGKSDTNILVSHVLVDISNAFICHGDNASEESISFGNQIVAPKVSKRDFFVDNKVTSYDGHASTSTSTTWNDNPTQVFPSKKDYMQVAGKDPHNPFLYLITDRTVLTDKVYDIDPDTQQQHFGNSKAICNADGTYTISLDLHNELAVTRYVKRMTYLSNKTPDFFRKVHLEFYTDNNLNLIESKVNETYSMVFMATSGSFKTRYYTKDVPDIPNQKENFDYEKYKF